MRIDLETCSRSVPLWRTDGTDGPLIELDFNQAALQNQVMTAGLSRFMPFSTSGMMGTTPYLFRWLQCRHLVLRGLSSRRLSARTAEGGNHRG
jgi:hypothetical protein